MSVHRGRFQAQGGGIEESEPWNQDSPVTADRGHGLLNALAAKLSKREREVRQAQFDRAHLCIDRAAAVGGLEAPFAKSFGLPTDPKIRVDIEIKAGRAFVRSSIEEQ